MDIDVVGRDEVAQDYSAFAQRIVNFFEGKNLKAIDNAKKNTGNEAKYLGQMFHHSEQWILQTLINNPELFVTLLRDRYKKPQGVKVYAILIEIHSTRDVCSKCQESINLIMRKAEPLGGCIKTALKNANYVVSEKSGLRIMARVSSEFRHAQAHRPKKDKEYHTAIGDVKIASPTGQIVAGVYDA
jgi:hypothetical protein